MAKWYPEGTIVTSGFSKWSSAGGWRVGYAIVPKEMHCIMTILQSAASQTYSCAPAPMQFAIAKVCILVENLTVAIHYLVYYHWFRDFIALNIYKITYKWNVLFYKQSEIIVPGK